MANTDKITKVSTQNKALAGLKVIQVTYKCYVDKVPVVMANPDSEYILREKTTNKEIDVYQFVGRVGGQTVNVAKTKSEMKKYNDFLCKIVNDKEIGAKLLDRDGDVCVRVNGLFLKETDTQICLMNPVFSV